MAGTPLDLVFTRTDDIAQFETLPAALVDLDEQFLADVGQFTKSTEGAAGTTSIVSGRYQIDHAGTRNDIVVNNAVAIPLPQFWVETTINVLATATGYDNGGVGIVKNSNNFIFAGIDRLGTGNTIRVRLQIKIGGTNTFLTTVNIPQATSFKLALSMVGTTCATWIDTGAGWVNCTIENIASYFDPRTTGNLAGWRYGFTKASGGGTSSWQFSNFRAGRFGRTGLRDMAIVSNEDGSPYFPSPDTILFIATVAHPGGTSASYTGVFSLDLITKAIAQTSVIFVQRDGKSHADHAGHIVWYANGNRRMLVGTWGNGFGGVIQTLHALFTAGDVLVGSNLVTMTQVNLPGQTGAFPGAYDATMAYDAANARWLIAYAITENTSFAGGIFYSAAAHTTDFSTFTLIGKDSATKGYEGTKLIRYNGQYFITAGGPAGAATSSRVYDVAMNYIGALQAVFQGGSDTQPHPMIFDYKGSYRILTFNNARYGTGTFTWGNLQLYAAPGRKKPASATASINISQISTGRKKPAARSTAAITFDIFAFGAKKGAKTELTIELASYATLIADLTALVRLGAALRARPLLIATLTAAAPRTAQQEDPDFIRANQDEPLDALIWRTTGLASGAVERVLDANPGLADMGTHLPEGFPVFLPPLTDVSPSPLALINLWD